LTAGQQRRGRGRSSPYGSWLISLPINNGSCWDLVDHSDLMEAEQELPLRWAI
jgi:hypothetical protein